jgi:tetratricopeptide (TPR) repeat protein
MAGTLSNMGYIYRKMGKAHDALKCLSEASRFAEEGGDKPLKAAVLINLSGLQFDRREFANCTNLLQESLALSKELNDTRGCARALDCLGTVQHTLGLYNSALESFKAALDFWVSSTDDRGAADTHFNWGVTLLEGLNLPSEASPHFQMAAETYSRFGSPEEQEARRAYQICVVPERGRAKLRPWAKIF